MWRRFSSLFRRQRLDRELSEEISLHLDLLVEEKIRQGLSPEDARAAAHREFGGIEHIKDEYRDLRGLPWIESVFTDCAYALRTMRRNLLFTVAVTVTLALGIGGSSAVFTVAVAVLLRPLQIPGPESVAVLLSTNPRDGRVFSVAEGVFADWRSRTSSFQGMAGSWKTSMVLSGEGQPRPVTAARTTAQLFPLMGLTAREGRLFDEHAEEPGHGDVAVLDEGFWRRELGGRRAVLGSRVLLDDRPYTVIGVVVSGFRLGHLLQTDIWLPFTPRREARGGGAVTVIARLKPGVTLAAARAELNLIQNQVAREHREDSPFGVQAILLHDWIVNEAKPALVALTGAVALLMILSCVSVANLLLVRGAARQREFAIRASLGGGFGRLTRQMLTENLLLAFLGGIAGWFVALLLVRAVPYIEALNLPRLDEVQPDGRMLIINALTTMTSAVLFGIVPAWRSSRGNISESLGVAATGTTAPAAMHLRRVLVAAQVGLSLMLLCAAGLLFNSFVRLATVQVGFRKANIVAARVRLPYKQYDRARSVLFHRRLMEELRGLPGVQDVSAADYLPLQAVHFPYELWVEGSQTTHMEALARHVEPRYFKVLDVPLVVGREFEPADDNRLPVPAVLNVEAARRLFNSERDALGRVIKTGYRDRAVLEVIGVAGNVRQLSMKQHPGPQIYLPMKLCAGGYTLARVAGNAGDLTAAIRAAVYRLDPTVPAPAVSEVRTWLDYELAKPRFYMLLLSVFAVVGLVVAITGVYGLVAFNVARRTHELGVRMALGASRAEILRLVIGREAIFIVAGACIGLAGALGSTRFLTALLYAVRPADTPTFAASCLLLIAAALLVCYWAARRATLREPGAALREE